MIILRTKLNTGEVVVKRIEYGTMADVVTELGTVSSDYGFIPNGRAIALTELPLISNRIQGLKDERSTGKK